MQAPVNYSHAFLSHLTLFILSEGCVVKTIDVDGHEKYQFEPTIEDDVYRILNVKNVAKVMNIPENCNVKDIMELVHKRLVNKQ